MKKVLPLWLTAAVSLLLLTGCAARPADNAGLPELVWYTCFEDRSDLPAVNEALNRLTEEKIGCTVRIRNLTERRYAEQLPLLLGGGEACDVLFIGGGFADYRGNALRGAFLPVDNLTDAPGVIPDSLWDSLRVNGRIYGVINDPRAARRVGLSVPTETLEKYGFDPSDFRELRDIEPLLAAIRRDNPEMIPISVNDIALLPMLGLEWLSEPGLPLAVRVGDESPAVVNPYDTEEWKDFATLMREWYRKGYLAADAATNPDIRELIRAGRVGCVLDFTGPGNAAESALLWGKEMTEIPLSESRITAESALLSLHCVPAASRYPEKAMAFIRLLNTDREVYNLVRFGIEGTHYTKVGENRIILTENSGYTPLPVRLLGTRADAFLFGSQPDDLWEQITQRNETTPVSELLGFVFDPTPVSSEADRCRSAWRRYYRSVVTGAAEPSVLLPAFSEALEEAGIDRLTAEARRQLDLWKAAPRRESGP